MSNKRLLCCILQITNINLDASRIANPSMEEVNSLDDRLDEPELIFKAAVDHLQTRVPMGEVSIELELWELPNELDGSPHILEDRRPVGFNVQRDRMPDRSA